ncbi:MAG: hypothetical protein QOH84_4585 [Kribbellaceae bacterium]|nr:hypothetical protein [Kribbellaceae bacterium]
MLSTREFGEVQAALVLLFEDEPDEPDDPDDSEDDEELFEEDSDVFDPADDDSDDDPEDDSLLAGSVLVPDERLSLR